MKLEYVDNKTLLTSIKKSHSHVWQKMSTEKVVTTDLFVFEYVPCSEIEVTPVRACLRNFCLKVTVIATGEHFVATQRMSFNRSEWTLFRVVEAKKK